MSEHNDMGIDRRALLTGAASLAAASSIRAGRRRNACKGT